MGLTLAEPRLRTPGGPGQPIVRLVCYMENMKRRAALVVFAVLAASLVVGSPAFAKDGEDDGSDDSSDDSGSGGGDDDGGDDDNSGSGDDSGGGDDDNSGGGDGGSGGSGSGSATHGDDDDHEDALTAVKNGRAVSLKKVLDRFKSDFGATVLDVALLQMVDALRYRITFVDADGRVRRVYYFAETGELIR